LDSPPVLLTAEARVLAERVDYTLVVVEAGRTTVGDVGAILKMLAHSHSSMQFVLNKTPVPSGGRAASYYSYDYGQK
jgi:receptor protein-tyrosine kinase